MRKILREQVQMGELDIGDVPIELDSRDVKPEYEKNGYLKASYMALSQRMD